MKSLRSLGALVTCLVALGVLTAGSARVATAEVVFGNLGTSGTGAITNTNTDVGPTAGLDIATSFTTGTSNLNVTSITLGLFGDGAISTTVDIFADATGEPAPSSLFSSSAVTVGVKGLYTFSFSGATLTANNTYWVIPQADVAWYIASAAPVEQNLSGYAFNATSENSGSGWLSAGSNRYSISVTAVPEPSTYALAAVGLGVAGFVRARRRKSVV
jgi:hypothetical protein